MDDELSFFPLEIIRSNFFFFFFFSYCHWRLYTYVVSMYGFTSNKINEFYIYTNIYICVCVYKMCGIVFFKLGINLFFFSTWNWHEEKNISLAIFVATSNFLLHFIYKCVFLMYICVYKYVYKYINLHTIELVCRVACRKSWFGNLSLYKITWYISAWRSRTRKTTNKKKENKYLYIYR